MYDADPFKYFKTNEKQNKLEKNKLSEPIFFLFFWSSGTTDSGAKVEHSS